MKRSTDPSILTPLVERIRERVQKGEVADKYLRIAEYMTDPKAPFPLPEGMSMTEFFESMRQSAYPDSSDPALETENARPIQRGNAAPNAAAPK